MQISKPKDLPSKKNFSEWYNTLIELAELSDKRYAIKGMNVWMPYGWKIMLNIDKAIREECDKTGHNEVNFPLLIPKTEFDKEAMHIKGFNQQVYWVDYAGENKLDIPLLLRPTSETAMYPIFSLWIRSHADLPLKTYQIVNTFRYETKQTRAFIRVREIHFFEAHTCHTDFEDAEKQVRKDFEILKNFAKKLCLPYKLHKRPEWDKFPGAFYSVGIDTLMPNGKTLQIGSIHQYKDNFALPYNIAYEDKKGERKFCHQTTYGMSERLLGAIIGIHGDDRGLILPPDIAPIQVVIIPIITKEKEEVIRRCRNLKIYLELNKVKCFIDESEKTTGWKFYNWEIKGVPLRIEIGKMEIDEGEIVLFRRDKNERNKKKIKILHQNTFHTDDDKPLAKFVKSLLKEIAENLYLRAEKILNDNIIEVKNFDSAKQIFDERKEEDEDDKKEYKIVKLFSCMRESCGKEIELTLGVNTLGTEMNREEEKGNCVICGKEGKAIFVARSY